MSSFRQPTTLTTNPTKYNDSLQPSFLAGLRAAKVQTRMGPDLRSAIERQPGLAGIALWVSFADSQEAHLVAATDGRNIFAGARYLEHPPKERLFILLHELLHVVLAHPTRRKELEKHYKQAFDPLAYNIACDAIINAALERGIGIVAPSDAIKLETVLRQLDLWPEGTRLEEAVKLWSSEALYRAIMQKRERIIETITIDVQAPSGANGLRNGDEDSAKTHEGELREWARRLQMARGVVPGLLDRLAGELPQVKTPWERLLRNHLYRHLGKRKRVYNRLCK